MAESLGRQREERDRDDANPSPTDDVQVAVSVKHPLNSRWTLWYFKQEKNVDWNLCQHRIHAFEYVEDFWSLYNHLRLPSDLPVGVDYSLFKYPIRPMWEDPQNCDGGRLTVVNMMKARDAASTPHRINELWMDILLFLIGENYEHADKVCGVVLNSRQYGFKVAIWTSTQDKSQVVSIGNSIKASLSTKYTQQIAFESHADTQKKPSSSAARFYI